MAIEERVASHYTHGSLEQAILEALRRSGKDIDRLHASDLRGVDEFHLGWHVATLELVHDLKIPDSAHVLDIGSGIGGPARTMVEECGCRVTGVDVTEEFVAVANALTRRCGLDDRASFQRASGLLMPFPVGNFDAAVLIHVGMNVKDKASLFAEARRVMKQGAPLGVYDIMKISDDELPYPLPWALTPETSFVESPDAYRRLLRDAGFTVEQEHDRSAVALKLADEMRETIDRDGPPPLGMHLIMRESTAERFANVIAALRNGLIAPTQMIARAA